MSNRVKTRTGKEKEKMVDSNTLDLLLIKCYLYAKAFNRI